MIETQVKCDGCGRVKQQTNHWFVMYAAADEYQLIRWNNADANHPDAKHICGQECASKALSEFMTAPIQPANPFVFDSQIAVQRDLPPATSLVVEFGDGRQITRDQLHSNTFDPFKVDLEGRN